MFVRPLRLRLPLSRLSASSRRLSIPLTLHPAIRDAAELAVSFIPTTSSPPPPASLAPSFPLPTRARPSPLPTPAIPPKPTAQLDPAQQPPSTTNPFPSTAVYVPPPTDPLLGFLTTMLMRHGLKSRARRHVSSLLSYLHSQTHSDPLPLLRTAIHLASPALKLTSHRHSAKTTLLPTALSERQRTRRAIVWIVEQANTRGDQSLHVRVGKECMDIVNGRSKVLDVREGVHRAGMLNRSNVYMPSRNR